MTNTQRVLIVEDSPEDAEVFKRYLERDPGNFSCTIATTGEAGLERLRTDAFSCVLLDYNLPDLNGLEFLEALGSDGPPCAVIVLTGVGDESLAMTSVQAGAEDYLTKSYLTSERLRRSVENAIARFELRHHLERERRHSAAVLASISDAFFAFDSTWNFTYVNPAGEKLFGLSAAQLIGHNIWELFSSIKGSNFHQALLKAAIKGQRTSFESSILHPEIWFEMHVHPAEQGLSVYAADITERKRNDERRRLLETVVLSANDAIIITSTEPFDEPGPRILYVNPAFEQMSGYSTQDVLGKTPRILQGEGSSREVLDSIRASLKSWQPVQAEVLNYRKDGSPFWVELSISPVADSSGWYTHWVSVQRDITERKQNEEALQKSEDRHRQSSEMQKRFVADAAHELRAPLTTIRGNLELLRRYENIVPEERLQMLGDAEREAARLSRLISDMLAVARGDAAQRADFSPLQFEQLLEQALRGASHLSVHHHLESDKLPSAMIYGDRDSLTQLALILFENALKYTPKGGTVRVSLLIEADWTELRVSDDGPGIAPEDLPLVFERFYRVDRARTPGRDPGGTGLGLPIARLVVEAHGGTVNLESTLGTGTTAVVRLPLLKPLP
jgi:PAS domain S-box-containing protein